MQDQWNQRYKDEIYFYGLEPNPQFKQFIDQTKPGKILLPAEGEGRNAVYAASKGWNVTALDYSNEAQQNALLLAKKHKVNIHYHIEDINTYQPTQNTYDCIACVFLHLPSIQLKHIYKHLLSALKPDGTLFIIGFNKAQLKLSSGGPKNEDWLFSTELFNSIFQPYNIIKNENIETHLSEGKGHKGPAKLTVAQIKK